MKCKGNGKNSSYSTIQNIFIIIYAKLPVELDASINHRRVLAQANRQAMQISLVLNFNNDYTFLSHSRSLLVPQFFSQPFLCPFLRRNPVRKCDSLLTLHTNVLKFKGRMPLCNGYNSCYYVDYRLTTIKRHN